MALYKNILVALDGSEEAARAFHKAVEIAKRDEAKLSLAHVVETVTTYYVSFDQESVTEKAEETLKEYEEKAQEAGLETETIIRFGSPKVIIAKELAPEIGADLIVTGSQGLNAVEHFLLGSVSENVVRHAHCDVLIVREDD